MQRAKPAAWLAATSTAVQDLKARCSVRRSSVVAWLEAGLLTKLALVPVSSENPTVLNQMA